MVAAGPVFTGARPPRRDRLAARDAAALDRLLSRAPSGHVVMMQGNDTERALMGELSAETLQFRGVRGYIVDGGCRDTAFIRRLGFPVFCDKATPRDIVGAWVPVAYDEPISYGQVVVRPGDYVLADCDGIVVIPQAIAAEVIDRGDGGDADRGQGAGGDPLRRRPAAGLPRPRQVLALVSAPGARRGREARPARKRRPSAPAPTARAAPTDFLRWRAVPEAALQHDASSG